MKKLWIVYVWLSKRGKSIGYALVSFTALIVLVSLLHAQTTATSGFNQATPDSIVRLTAESQGLELMAPADLPRSGTFWLVLPGGGAAPFPCPLPDSNAPVFQVTEDQFIVDCTDGTVPPYKHRLGAQNANDELAAGLAAEAETVVNLINQIQTAAENERFRARCFVDGLRAATGAVA